MAGGLALKSLSLFLRLIEFCCAAIILGIFSYFLATLHNHSLVIPTWLKAVEGISGVAVLYTILALLLVCCLGGIAFFSALGMLLDLAFCGAFIYIAWATRGGAGSCSGQVNTPLGFGNTNVDDRPVTDDGVYAGLETACKLNKACFAVAIIGCIFFFLSIFVELGLIKHHRHEKRFGPSPNNGYTAGSPKRKFWQRKPRTTHVSDIEKNPDVLPVHATPADVRTSYATDVTAVGHEQPVNKYGNTGVGHAGVGHQNGLHQNGLGHHGVTGNGHQTTTTTHVPHQTYGQAPGTTNPNF